MVQLVGGNPNGPRRHNVQRSQFQRTAPVQRTPVQPVRRPLQRPIRPITSIDGIRPATPSYRPIPQHRQTPRPAPQQNYTRVVLERQQTPVKSRLPNLKLLFSRFLSNRYALGSGLMVVSLVAGATILFWPQKSLSETELEYFRQKLTTIRTVSEEIKKHNDLPLEQTILDNNINSYNDALLNGLVACEEIDTHVDTTSKELLEPYIDSINQVRLFCGDFEDVVDYARKVSKATKQIITYDARQINNSATNKSVQDTYDILGFTRNDLDELKGLPAQDPANEEMLVMLDENLKLAADTLQDPSESSKQALSESTLKLQNNLITARNYYWTNTVKIESMIRSINRLHGLFEEEKL